MKNTESPNEGAGDYAHEMHLYEPNQDPMSAPDITMHKAQSNAMPLHEILGAMGHHDMAKLVKKHAPKQKMKISSMHIKKGGY